MAGSGTLNLSLLSRGVGEVQRNGHEKVEVKLEPADYFNWVDDPTRLYLPPILPATKVAFSETPRSFRGSPKNVQEAHLPKTFTTRKGALLLFSEDMAQKRRKNKAYTGTQSKMSTSLDDLDLNTVEDFAKKILSYGSHSSDDSDRVYLKFVHDRHRDRYRFIRPGYSPKRYLANWSRSVDENFLSKLTAKGYLNEKSLQQSNVFLPHVKSHINEDLSRYPAPYRIMRHMLMSPGSLSGYTFFWARPRSADSASQSLELGDDKKEITDIAFALNDQAMSGLYEEDEDKKKAPTEGADSKWNVQDGSIKVLQQDDEGNFKEVHYGELDKQTQQNVLTELLVKSAISHALMKQQEVMEELSKSSESIMSASHDGRDSGISAPPVPDFDMVEAVESLLNTTNTDAPVHKERATTKPRKLDVGSIPETGNDSRSSRYGGSFKGAALRGSVPLDKRSTVSDKSKDSYQSWAIDKDQFSPEITRSTHSLPPVASTHGLSPIKDVDVPPTRESGVPVLPPIEGMYQLDAPPIQIEPPTPQATTLSGTQLARGDGVPSPTSEAHDDDDQSWAGTDVSEAPWGQTSDDEDRGKRHTGSKKGSTHSLPVSDRSGGFTLVGHAVHSSTESLSQSSSIKSFQMNLDDGLRTDRSSQRGQQSQRSRSKSKSPSTSPARTETSSKQGSDTSRRKGSLIMGPGGDVIPIGGAAQMAERPEPRDGESVYSEETETAGWRSSSRSLPEHIKESETRYGPRGSASQKSLEEEVLGQLAEHASKIAAGVLSSNAAGLDLAKDAKDAALLWTDQYGPASDISRSQSVREVSEREALQDLMNARKGSQSEPSMNEYKDLLKTTLTNIVSNTSGSAITIPPDAEIDDDLVKALLNEDLAPDDIEVFTDTATGKSIIRSKSQMMRAMGDVEEGHTYQKGGKRAPSIPRQSLVGDVGELDIINYAQLPGEEENGSEKGTRAMSVTIRSKKSAGPEDAVDGADAWKDGRETGTTAPPGDEIMRESSVTSQGRRKSGASESASEGKGQSVKSLKSKASADKKDEKPEFKVGKVKEEKTLPGLYGPYDQPAKREESSVAEPPSKASTSVVPDKTKKQKGKVAKPKVSKPKKEPKKKVVKKKKPATPPPREPTPPPPPKEPTPPPPAEPTPRPPTEHSSRHSATPSWRTPSPESEGSSIIIVRDEFSDDETTDRKSGATSLLKTETEDFSDSDESALLRQMNNKALRAAKRNAQAEKRRQDVERKRREREEQIRREKEEHERQERLRQELEEERRRKEEERRLNKEKEALERQSEEAALIAEEKRRMRELERERKLMEEHQRRLEELKRKQMEEERIRKELQRERELEEAERRRVEEEMLAQMEVAERAEYERRKQEEEERKRQEAELERQRQEEEARRQMEEARRLAEELERKKKEFERRLKFARGLMVEAKGMDHTQDINRAFVWSYFELLQWLGLDLPKEPFLGP
ncbi:titin homolog isoform X3 [Lineus longissimus]|uniref:titin homolog isoform X3 n=1 Tax=Lineus longissimus TaxID=88925 RepID=UPI00315CAFCF